jgi:hypothetical protein
VAGEQSEGHHVEGLGEDDLLLPFEKQYLRDPIRRYTQLKRNNRFATVQALPEIWASHELLDSIFELEFDDLYNVTDPNVPLPLSLFIGAFFRTRVSFELGSSGCVVESADLMRGAIEYGLHGLRILEQPKLASVWMNKDRGKDEFNAYRESFEREKQDRLFNGQEVLHRYWTQFSEWGSHSTKAALALRLSFKDWDALKVKVEFFETDLTRLADFLLMLLDAGHRLEVILFECFRGRLTLDVALVDMRNQFEHKRQVAESRRPRLSSPRSSETTTT